MYATGAVAGGGFGGYTGGLIGYNDSRVEQAYATGDVDGGSGTYTGGLIGFNAGRVTQAYATGEVLSGAGVYTGGLIGYNTGSVTQSYATGLVTGNISGDGFDSTGGLIGFNAPSSNGTSPSPGGTVTASFWDTQTTGQNQAAGNVVDLSGATGLLRPSSRIRPSSYLWRVLRVGTSRLHGRLRVLANTRNSTALIPSSMWLAKRCERQYGQPNPALTGTIYGGPGVYVFDASRPHQLILAPF